MFFYFDDDMAATRIAWWAFSANVKYLRTSSLRRDESNYKYIYKMWMKLNGPSLPLLMLIIVDCYKPLTVNWKKILVFYTRRVGLSNVFSKISFSYLSRWKVMLFFCARENRPTGHKTRICKIVLWNHKLLKYMFKISLLENFIEFIKSYQLIFYNTVMDIGRTPPWSILGFTHPALASHLAQIVTPLGLRTSYTKFGFLSS